MFIAFEMSCTTILSLDNAEKKKPFHRMLLWKAYFTQKNNRLRLTNSGTYRKKQKYK